MPRFPFGLNYSNYRENPFETFDEEDSKATVLTREQQEYLKKRKYINATLTHVISRSYDMEGVVSSTPEKTAFNMMKIFLSYGLVYPSDWYGIGNNVPVSKRIFHPTWTTHETVEILDGMSWEVIYIIRYWNNRRKQRERFAVELQYYSRDGDEIPRNHYEIQLYGENKGGVDDRSIEIELDQVYYVFEAMARNEDTHICVGTTIYGKKLWQ